jgi:hypothetical protein
LWHTTKIFLRFSWLSFIHWKAVWNFVIFSFFASTQFSGLFLDIFIHPFNLLT